MDFQTITDNIRVCITEKYAHFSGRATRTEFWSFVLSFSIIRIILYLLGRKLVIFDLLGDSFWLAVIMPVLAVSWRRLHDTGKAGSLFFLGMIPVAGWILLIIWFCQDSQPGLNEFGPNPKDSVASAAYKRSDAARRAESAAVRKTPGSESTDFPSPETQRVLDLLASCLNREFLPVQRKYVVWTVEFRAPELGLPTSENKFYLGFDRRMMTPVMLVYIPDNSGDCYEILLNDMEYDEIAGCTNRHNAYKIWGHARYELSCAVGDILLSASASRKYIPAFCESPDEKASVPVPEEMNNLSQKFRSFPVMIVSIDGNLYEDYYSKEDPVLGFYDVYPKKRFLDIYSIDDLYEIHYAFYLEGNRVPILWYSFHDGGLAVSAEYESILNTFGVPFSRDSSSELFLKSGDIMSRANGWDYTYNSILDEVKEKMEKLAPPLTAANTDADAEQAFSGSQKTDRFETE